MNRKDKKMAAKCKLTILLAEDDPDDRFLLKTAFVESSIYGQLKFVTDGEELMDYLLHQGEYANETPLSRPDMVLLDLNMPKKDGREVLREMKQHPSLRDLPVIVLTTSNLEQDKEYCLNLGVSAYIVKPNSYVELLKMMEEVKQLSQ